MTSKRRLIRGSLIAWVLAACVLAAPSLALAKSFEIADVYVAASFDAAGNLHIDESRTFDFSGSFSWVEWSLSTEGSDSIYVTALYETGGAGASAGAQKAFERVDGTAVEPGTYSVAEEDGALKVHVAIDVTNSQYTLRLIYVANAAVKKYSDCAELYWKFIGDETSVPTRNVRVEIAPPTPLLPADMLAWAHGPLNGDVSISAGGVVFVTVSELPEETLVAARVLYPPTVLSDVPDSTTPREDLVVAEEEAYRKSADAERVRVMVFYWIAMIGSVALSLVGLAFVVWAFVMHGREYRASFQGGYLREDPMPTLHPAVVGALWRMGDAADSDIAATLMELADNKIITMQPATVDARGVAGFLGVHNESYVLERVPGATAPHALDRELMRILFDEAGDGTRIDLAALRDYAKANASSYTKAIAAWKKSAGEEAARLGLVDKDSRTYQIVTWFVTGTIGFAGFFASVFTEDPLPILVALPAAVATGVLGVFMRRRSMKGNELYRQYHGVRDYLKDFSRLDEAPPASIVLWNRFLVLAVVFGIADKVIEQLRDVAPQVVADAGFQTTYWWAYSSGGSSPIHAVQSGFTSAASIATSQMSSSGGGGGFSGGGGGGGGGGGVSAG